MSEQTKDKKDTTVVLGATGEIGRRVVRELSEHPEVEHIYAMVRRPNNPGIAFPKVHEMVVSQDTIDADLDRLLPSHVDAVFSCLGTTFAQTPNEVDYLAIEMGIPARVIERTKNRGLSQFHIVTSTGADPNSMFLYLRMKGRIELMIKNENIPYGVTYQPGILTQCDRSPRSIAEYFTPVVGGFMGLFPFIPSFDQSQSVPVAKVAQTMVDDYITARQRVDPIIGTEYTQLKEKPEWKVYPGSGSILRHVHSINDRIVENEKKKQQDQNKAVV